MEKRRTGKWPGRAVAAVPVWRMAWRLAPHRGFTLIELMIVVAILGLLAAFAIPAYQAYIVKAQIGRAFWEASAYKIPVEERLNQGVHTFADPVAALGYVRSSLTGTANRFVFDAQGVGGIVVTLDGDVHPLVRGTRITVGRLVDGSWNCVVLGGSDEITTLHLPLACSLDTGS